jgi:hypothetical protein
VETSGPVQACNGIALRFTFTYSADNLLFLRFDTQSNLNPDTCFRILLASRPTLN